MENAAHTHAESTRPSFPLPLGGPGHGDEDSYQYIYAYACTTGSILCILLLLLLYILYPYIVLCAEFVFNSTIMITISAYILCAVSPLISHVYIHC